MQTFLSLSLIIILLLIIQFDKFDNKNVEDYSFTECQKIALEFYNSKNYDEKVRKIHFVFDEKNECIVEIDDVKYDLFEKE